MGREARMLLENPLLVAALKVMKLGCYRDWTNTAAPDVEAREQNWQMLQAANDFERLLTKTVTSGNLAELTARAEELEADQQQGFTSPNERRTRL